MSTHTLGTVMVANVHTVFVKMGDTGTRDIEVVLLESMKMAIPVLAQDLHGFVREQGRRLWRQSSRRAT